MEQEQVKRIIEALLFVSEKPLTILEIKEVLEEADSEMLKSQVLQLRQEYQQQARSFSINEVAGGYQLSTSPEYSPWLNKLYRKSRAEKLSRPSLETLAIIAYRQPISRHEVEDIRGVNVDGVLRTLLERSLVRICGRKKIAGRPFLYSTTRQFLESFGLQSLEELPKLEEFESLTEETRNELFGQSGGEEDGEVKEITQEDRPD